MIKCNLTAKAKAGMLWALAHHATAIRPAVLELLAQFYLTDVDGIHDVGRWNGRQNTYVEFGGKRYFFHWDGGVDLEVRESFRGPIKWTIRSRSDALGWCRTVGLA